jgi:hypothetical protein
MELSVSAKGAITFYLLRISRQEMEDGVYLHELLFCFQNIGSLAYIITVFIAGPPADSDFIGVVIDIL